MRNHRHFKKINKYIEKIKIKYFFIISIILLWTLLLCDCAVFRKDFRTTFNTFEEKCVPENTKNKILLSPILVPAGVVALIIDAFIVNPKIMFSIAFDTTQSSLWPSDSQRALRNRVSKGYKDESIKDDSIASAIFYDDIKKIKNGDKETINKYKGKDNKTTLYYVFLPVKVLETPFVFLGYYTFLLTFGFYT